MLLPALPLRHEKASEAVSAALVGAAATPGSFPCPHGQSRAEGPFQACPSQGFPLLRMLSPLLSHEPPRSQHLPALCSWMASQTQCVGRAPGPSSSPHPLPAPLPSSVARPWVCSTGWNTATPTVATSGPRTPSLFPLSPSAPSHSASPVHCDPIRLWNLPTLSSFPGSQDGLCPRHVSAASILSH